MTTPGTADESASSAGTGDSVERRESLPEGTSSGPMSSAEFRRHGRRIVDWIADYMDRVADLPVQSRVSPGEIRSGAAAHPPLSGEPSAALLPALAFPHPVQNLHQRDKKDQHFHLATFRTIEKVCNLFSTVIHSRVGIFVFIAQRQKT